MQDLFDLVPLLHVSPLLRASVPGTVGDLLALLSLSIVASFQAIGTLLVFGLLVAPPATATLLVKKVPLIMAVSMLVGFIAVISGLLISFHYGTAGGATMAGISVLEFFIVMIAQSTYRTLQKDKTEVETDLVQTI